MITQTCSSDCLSDNNAAIFFTFAEIFNYILARLVIITPTKNQSDIIPFIEPPQAVAPRDRVLNQAEIKQLRQFCSALVWQGPGRAISNRISKVGRFITLAMETAQRKTAILEN